MSIESIRADLTAYEERDSSNYYGRLVQLQATLFANGPALLAIAEALKAARWHWEECEYGGEGGCCYEADRALIAAGDALEPPKEGT